MSIKTIRKPIIIPLIAIIISMAMGCNSKTETESEIAITYSIVAVKNFTLTANSQVMSHLDSVFFSIDLNHGIIYNADSLPKCTDVSRLIPVITFANNMTKADLVFNLDNRTDTTVNYLTHSTDSIDFTHPVKLEVTAADGSSNFTYTIKVNVHKEEPDSMIWDLLASAPLPSRLENPVCQKSLIFNDRTFCLIEEYDGTYTMSQSDDLFTGNWTKKEIAFPFSPQIESFCNSTDNLWILSESGSLYSSSDGMTWEPTDEVWISIIGGYSDNVLGLRDEGGYLMYSCYPGYEGFQEYDIDPDFPVYSRSQFGVIETGWSPLPIGIVAGGITLSGQFSSEIWGFDGKRWAAINNTSLPAVSSPMLVHYIVYRDTQRLFTRRAFDAWFLFGGVFEDGTFSRTVYISMDNGVNWSVADDMIQLPESFPDLSGADVLVSGYELSANLSDLWEAVETKSPDPGAKISYSLEGYDISWVCPYMYVFGGYSVDHILSPFITRGVLARLTFTPII